MSTNKNIISQQNVKFLSQNSQKGANVWSEKHPTYLANALNANWYVFILNTSPS